MPAASSTAAPLDLDSIPLGLCPDCLQQLAAGSMHVSAPLPGDRTVVFVYCAHHEFIAEAVIRAGRPGRWRITGPVDALNVQEFLEARTRSLRAAVVVAASQFRGVDTAH